jgi:RimJ/RimL family protein N-acetyltransferase
MREILKRYPRAVGDRFTLRLLKAGDEAALYAFFRRIPIDERQHFREDVLDRSILRGWVRNLRVQTVLPLLLLDGRRIVADATLRRHRHGWSRHVGRIRITLDPAYRRRGLGKALVREFIDLAPGLGIAILDAEVLSAEKGAARLFEGLGFFPAATLPQHALDLASRVHDIVVYTCTVTPPERLAPEVALAEEDADLGGEA